MTQESIPPDSREMAMIYMIDSIGKRYGLLPSETMARASTFDLFIMDAALTYENYLREQGDADVNKPKQTLTQDQMRAMLEKVRGTN